MHACRRLLKRRLIHLCWPLLVLSTSNGQAQTAAQLGTQYASLSLMTVLPDISAANYRDRGTEATTDIYRLPWRLALSDESSRDRVSLELAAGYQFSEQRVFSFGAAQSDEFVDSDWRFAGLGLGVLLRHDLSESTELEPSLRLGIVEIRNQARYFGPLTTTQIKPEVQGSLFDWRSDAVSLTLGLGGRHRWTMLERHNELSAHVYHAWIDSFDESFARLRFSERVSLLNVRTELLHAPEQHGLDWFILAGLTQFVGENRDALGFTQIRQLGVGLNIPLGDSREQPGRLRLSAEALAGHQLDGWLIGLGYQSRPD